MKLLKKSIEFKIYAIETENTNNDIDFGKKAAFEEVLDMIEELEKINTNDNNTTTL